MKQNVYFVSGIDTDAGKVTRPATWHANGIKRQKNHYAKFIQTGNVGHSEDIDLHRRIMEIPFTQEDQEGLTMPEIFSYPASPIWLPDWIIVPLISTRSSMLAKY